MWRNTTWEWKRSRFLAREHADGLRTDRASWPGAPPAAAVTHSRELGAHKTILFSYSSIG